MSNKLLNVKINGKDYTGKQGQTVLEVARDNGFEIPTLCYDKNLKPYTSCFVCVAKVEKARGLQPACSLAISEGMDIKLDLDVVKDTRKTNLELLMSNHFADCYAPCKLACPANVDIQGYIALAKRGQFKEAIKLIKDSIPLPATIGRVCPRPCEDSCRRQFVDEAVAIDDIKRVIADKDLFSESPYIPLTKNSSDKKIAVIGAGPSGLSAAFYLAKEGHEVEVFEKHSNPGGMLRYGIPSYRLDKDVLDLEVKIIEAMGVKFHYNTALGRDISYQDLKRDFDSIFLGVGAQKGFSLGVKGEDFENIHIAVDFLQDVQNEKYNQIHGTVFVIGGGNTAIDAARTSLRLGADKVIIGYRRTEYEMPANKEEIEEAKEEGVEIRELVNPVEYIGNDGKLDKVRFIKMELGEPDDSGRRRPIPIVGSEHNVLCDYVIEAIGQRVDDKGFEGKLDTERKGWLKVDQLTYETSDKGVFAGGDCAIGPDLVVTALAHGRKAAYSINKFLESGEAIAEDRLGYYIRKDDFREINEDDYIDYEKKPRNEVFKTDSEKRVRNFKEFNNGLSDYDFEKELDRCLECGCQDVKECKLREYSHEYNIDSSNFFGENKDLPSDNSHPYIYKENNKCINCGRCISICQEYVGLSIFGFNDRGFVTDVQTTWNTEFGTTDCVSCGNCVSACPVGALTEKHQELPVGPFENEKVLASCIGCGKGCQFEYEVKGDKVIKANTEDIVCKSGKFGWQKYDQITSFENIDLDYLIERVDNEIQSIKDKENLVLVSPYLGIDNYEKLVKYYPNSLVTSWEIIRDLGKLQKLLDNGISVINSTEVLDNKYNYSDYVILDSLIDEELSSFYYQLFQSKGNFYIRNKDEFKKMYKNVKLFDRKDYNSDKGLLVVNISNLTDEELNFLIDNKNSDIVFINPYPNYNYLLARFIDNVEKKDIQDGLANLITYGENANTSRIKNILKYNKYIRFDYDSVQYPLNHPLSMRGKYYYDDNYLRQKKSIVEPSFSYKWEKISYVDVKNQKYIENQINNYGVKLGNYGQVINNLVKQGCMYFTNKKIYN